MATKPRTRTDSSNDAGAGPAKSGFRRRCLQLAVGLFVLAILAVVFRPLVVEVALTRGEACLDDRRHERALFWLNLSHALESERAEVHFQLARAHRRLGHFDQVEHHLGRAADLGWNIRQLEREQWIALAQTGQYADIRQHWDELFTEAGSDGPEISNAYVTMLLSQFRLTPALQVLSAWEQDFPEDPQPHMLRARIWEVTRNWVDCVKEYQQALELDPGQSEAHYQMARALMQQLKFEDAERHLRQYLQSNPSRAEAAVARAICLRKLGQIDEARQILTNQLRENPDDLEALREMGTIELADGDPEAALKHLKRATKINEVDREIRYALARALKAAGQTEAAQKEFAYVNEATKPVLRLGTLIPRLVDEPGNIALRHEIAMTTWKYKSREEGARWFHSLLDFAPNHAITHRALARHYELLGNTQRAQYHQRQAEQSEDPQQ